MIARGPWVRSKGGPRLRRRHGQKGRHACPFRLRLVRSVLSEAAAVHSADARLPSGAEYGGHGRALFKTRTATGLWREVLCPSGERRVAEADWAAPQDWRRARSPPLGPQRVLPSRRELRPEARMPLLGKI